MLKVFLSAILKLYHREFQALSLANLLFQSPLDCSDFTSFVLVSTQISDGIVLINGDIIKCVVCSTWSTKLDIVLLTLPALLLLLVFLISSLGFALIFLLAFIFNVKQLSSVLDLSLVCFVSIGLSKHILVKDLVPAFTFEKIWGH